MLMTSSSGCGLKTSTVCGSSPAGCVQIVAIISSKTRRPSTLGRAVLAQQFVQLVFAEVVVGQLEQRLVDLAGSAR